MTHIRIGTRDSELAVWQAEQVKRYLDQKKVSNEIVIIKTEGDLNLKDPLHQMGTVGLFTKSLDDALMDDRIDIAVHSCKDYPTLPPEELEISAYLERGYYQDIFIRNKHIHDTSPKKIATGSIRRKAQWLNKYPQDKIENLRGNVKTRLDKIENGNFNGGILALAGFKRLNIEPEHWFKLDWMLPAPAQGVVIVVSRKENQNVRNILEDLDHKQTRITSQIERDFLRTLEGGCSAPIGALAILRDSKIKFEGILLNEGGELKVNISEEFDLTDAESAGERLANKVIESGGDNILKLIRDHGYRA